MVDEMGQFISDDTQLMLNLQTVVEELGKECLGKAWVIVTSQEDIDHITQVKGNDFSKIQGRFNTRLSLSSANVATVIKKRLLEKTETAAQELRLYYEQNATIIKNKIVFNDLVVKKLYDDGQDFADVYPFVTYQFDLLASVLTAIRTHGASGKHLSEGERSMLAVFQESAMELMNKETGALAPFYSFYDPLENFLDHSHKGVISRAYENSLINPDHKERDVFAINVLKTLFLIKYVNEVEPNLENITSLMINNVDQDRTALKNDVEEALKILMSQMLVQKNDQLYTFLTDEEQEINRAIDRQEIGTADVINRAAKIIYEDIIPDGKYRYPKFKGRYIFPFNQAIDDRFYNKLNINYQIGIRILTPWYSESTDDTTLRMMSNQIMSNQGKEALVLLPNDASFLDELSTALKIEKFIRLNPASQLSEYEAIKQAKQIEMREHQENAKRYLNDALCEAAFYINGDTANIPIGEAKDRINEALKQLVTIVFYKLDDIDKPTNEADIRRLFHDVGQTSLNLDEQSSPNAKALIDVSNYIEGQSQLHEKTSMKTIKNRFMKAPYEFIEDDVHWLIAYLFTHNDISLIVNGEIITLSNISDSDIIYYITKKEYVDKLLIDLRIHISDKDKQVTKYVMQEVFGKSSSIDDEDILMQDFQKLCQEVIHDIEGFELEYRSCPYPGKQVLEKGKQLL